ncbi:MAG: hypothetical protein QM654_05920 [Dysgonamonadaceae bacterium]
MWDINNLDPFDDERPGYMLELGMEILPEYSYEEETDSYEVFGTIAQGMFVKRSISYL